MVSAYPGLFYPGDVYPAQVDTVTPPPPTTGGDTTWGSWLLTRDGRWIRRETRTLVWGGATPGVPWDVLDGSAGTNILDGSSGTDIVDGIWPLPSSVPLFDGNGTTDILDGGGTVASIYDGNG